MIILGLILYSMISGCRSNNAPAASDSDIEKYTRGFHSRGGTEPYFGYNERAREVERNLGL